MSERFAMLSPPWLALFEREAQRLVDLEEGTDVRFTLAEVIRDTPADVPRAPGREPGFELHIEGGKASVRLGVDRSQPIDLLKEGSWTDGLISARMHIGPERNAFLLEAFNAGRITLRGDMARVPTFLAGLHDAVADATA